MAAALADSLRFAKARQAVSGERDRLLKRAERRIDLSRYVNGDGKDQARAIALTACYSVLGMAPYVGMTLIWFTVYHDSFLQAMIGFVVLFVVSFLFLAGSTQRAMGKERPWMWWFGLVWLQAATVGLVAGFFWYFRSMAYFWKHEEMRTYTNVAGAQSSDGLGDGSMFLFTEDTRLDSLRAVGYKSKWTGQTYCVAPIVDASMNQGSDINYWAVGENCCTPRAEFHCGDAKDFTVRAALRKIRPAEVVRPWMAWAVQADTYPKYMEAIKLQVASYYTRAARNPTLVLWSKDPIELKESYFSDARDMCVTFSLVYFAVVVLGCYWAAWKLLPQKRPEGVLRDS